MEISKLLGLKQQAIKEGWAYAIKTAADEQALLQGYYFDREAGDLVVEFFENFLVLPKSGGKNFELLQYQIDDIIHPLFGWMRPDGSRRFRRGYIEMPKKQGKTTLAAGIGGYMLLGDGEPGAEVYCCANDKEQAKIVWSAAASMIEESTYLRDQVEILRSTSRIVKDSQSWFAAWSSDKSSKDGPNIFCAILDELHEWDAAGRDFWKKIRYGAIARNNRAPLCPLVITTAGTADRESLCLEQHNYAAKLLDGTIDNDLNFFARIYAADPQKLKENPDYWKTEECWREANPSYGTILSAEGFAEDIRECENDPGAKAAFFRYRLGIWTQSKNPWIDGDVWRKNIGKVVESELTNRKCWTGLDLASVEDTVAMVHVFPYCNQETGKWHFKLLPRIFCPEDQIEKRAHELNVRYDLWLDEGLLISTPGPVIDHEFVYSYIEKDSETFDIQMLSYDRRSSDWIIAKIGRDIPRLKEKLDPFGQGFSDMSAPCKNFLRALKQGRIEHGDHKVLNWMASNAVAQYNAAGDIILNKTMAKDKIDGIIASVMGFGRANLYAENQSFEFFYGSEDFQKIKNAKK